MAKPHEVLYSRRCPLDELSLSDHLLLERLCDDFEAAWAQEEQPELAAFLDQAPPNCRALLLAELWAVERHYRRDESGQPLTDEALCELHPQFRGAVEGLSTKPDDPPSSSPPGLAGGRHVTRDLHIRCPHCRAAVELLEDAPVDSVECNSCGSQFSLVESPSPADTARVLKTLGRFELISRVGVGGFGSVWKARDTELDRIVALKIPRKGRLSRREVEWFLREARSAAQLRHPNIVPVFEVCQEGETLFIVSEFVDGVSLADWMSEHRRTAREIAELCLPLADALHAAHSEGVVHRDLKPANVMLDGEGRLRLMDFGLAKREANEVTMTFDGQVLGTPAYMSPEQARGEAHWIDRRTDVYSLGVMLFHMLTGELPFRGSVSTQIHQRLTADPPNPRSLDPTIPLDIATICLKCMERSPNRRYATAAELSEELGRFLEGRPIRARPLSRLNRASRWVRRKPFQGIALLLAVVLAIGGPAAALLSRAQNKEISRRLGERDALVLMHEGERVRLQGELKKLRDRLAQLSGGAKPASTIEPWRIGLTRSLLEDRLVQYDKQAADMPAGEARAEVYYSLARMLEATDRPAESAEYYRKAMQSIPQETLEAISDPTAATLAARSGLRLIQLQMDTQSIEEARKTLAEVRGLINPTQAEAEPIVPPIEAYAAELASVGLGGREEKADKLLEADAIRRTVQEQWPTSVKELPSLTRRLLGGSN